MCEIYGVQRPGFVIPDASTAMSFSQAKRLVTGHDAPPHSMSSKVALYRVLTIIRTLLRTNQSLNAMNPAWIGHRTVARMPKSKEVCLSAVTQDKDVRLEKDQFRQICGPFTLISSSS